MRRRCSRGRWPARRSAWCSRSSRRRWSAGTIASSADDTDDTDTGRPGCRPVAASLREAHPRPSRRDHRAVRLRRRQGAAGALARVPVRHGQTAVPRALAPRRGAGRGADQGLHRAHERLVMENHGVTTLGRTVSEAYHRLNTLTSEVHFLAPDAVEWLYRDAERVAYPWRDALRPPGAGDRRG